MLKATVGPTAYLEAFQLARDVIQRTRSERKRKRAFEVCRRAVGRAAGRYMF